MVIAFSIMCFKNIKCLNIAYKNFNSCSLYWGHAFILERDISHKKYTGIVYAIHNFGLRETGVQITSVAFRLTSGGGGSLINMSFQ